MKKILFLLLLLPFATIAQTEIPKGAQKIIVKNDLTAKQNFALIMNTMLDNDYLPETKDTSINYIKTQPKKVNKWTGIYFLNIRAMDNKVVISGMFKFGMTINVGGVTADDIYEPITKKGMKSSLYWEAFNVMDAFAKKLMEV